MKPALFLRAFIASVSFAIAAGGAMGCAADTSDDDTTATADEDLAVGKLNTHFGAAGISWTNPASVKVFKDLHNTGLTHVRQAAYISFGRYATTIPADVANVKLYPGADLFLMVHLADCAQATAMCSDILTPDVTAAAVGFRAHFEDMWAVANPGDVQNVTTWGINEPDLNLASLKDAPERAALFYKVARDVLNEHGCTGCKLVAGELAYGATDFTTRYCDELKKLGEKPATFSMHPYGDVDEAHADNYKTVKATRTDRFMTAVRAKFPDATFWLTETGRMLPQAGATASEEWAAGAFVRDRLAKTKGVARVYWWDMGGEKPGPTGKCSWDSALADGEGTLRASYYGLLGDSEEAALKKAAKAHVKPCD